MLGKLSKADLRSIVTVVIISSFLLGIAYLTLKASKNIDIDTDTFKMLVQTFITLLSVAVGWLFRGAGK